MTREQDQLFNVAHPPLFWAAPKDRSPGAQSDRVMSAPADYKNDVSGHRFILGTRAVDVGPVGSYGFAGLVSIK